MRLSSRARLRRARSRRRHRPPDGRGGFALVEIIVAMLLVTIIATGLASYTGSVARDRVLSKQRAVAYIAAMEAIDDVRSKRFDQIAAGTVTTSSAIGRFPLTVTTTVELSTPRMKLVSATVRNAAGKQLQYFVTTAFKEVP